MKVEKKDCSAPIIRPKKHILFIAASSQQRGVLIWQEKVSFFLHPLLLSPLETPRRPQVPKSAFCVGGKKGKFHHGEKGLLGLLWHPPPPRLIWLHLRLILQTPFLILGSGEQRGIFLEIGYTEKFRQRKVGTK